MREKLRAVYAVKDKIKALAEKYGPVAFGTWFAIFFLTLGAFYLAIENGVMPAGAAGRTGTVAMAYGATQLTKPLRAVATIALTPVLARWFGYTGKPVAEPSEPAEVAPEAPEPG